MDFHSHCLSNSISDSDAKKYRSHCLSENLTFSIIYINIGIANSIANAKNGIPTHSLAKLSAMKKASLTLTLSVNGP